MAEEKKRGAYERKIRSEGPSRTRPAINVTGANRKRIALSQVNDAVIARCGPTRVPGNHQPFAFNRHVAMYLAYTIGRWSSPAIGHFYNNRHHTTVLYAVQQIAEKRAVDPSMNALIEELIIAIGAAEQEPRSLERMVRLHSDTIQQIVAGITMARTEERVDLVRMCVQREAVEAAEASA